MTARNITRRSIIGTGAVSACLVALASGGLISEASAQAAPPIGGGYTNVTAIPVNDAATKVIAGALFKPAGAGPFPAVIYISGCAGLNAPPEVMLERTVTDHLLAKGVATLIVDPFTPRNEPQGMCASVVNLNEKTDVQINYFIRGGNDALAAVKVLRAMPEIDPKRIFLLGYSYGAISSLFATDAKKSGADEVAGVVAFYPYCYDNIVPSRPTLVLHGDKDDWTPADLCQKLQGKPNAELVVYPGVFHAFASPRGEPIDFLGHHIVFDVKAALDAQKRVDAFMAAQMK
jgi:dienelactone hydrolase